MQTHITFDEVQSNDDVYSSDRLVMSPISEERLAEIQAETVDPLTEAVRAWQQRDEAGYETWLVNKKAPCDPAVAALLRPEAGVGGGPAHAMPEGLGKAVYGWKDETWGDYHGSQTQGPGEYRKVDDGADLTFLHRDDADFEQDGFRILHRWNKPEDELLMLDVIAQRGLQVWNAEIITAVRRVQLHTVAKAYFGTADYAKRDIVLKWQQVDGRWQPALKMKVADWIALRIEEKGGSTLAGYTSCLRTLQRKMELKDARTPFARNLPVLSDEAVHQVIADAVKYLPFMSCDA